MLWIYLILLSAFLLVIYVSVKTLNPKLSKQDITFFHNQIQEIAKLEFSQQILEFDKLLDLALAKLGKKGTLGEKLKKSNNLFKNLDDVWKVHKIRNRIAHEVGFVLSENEFKKFKRIYLDAFLELKIK